MSSGKKPTKQGSKSSRSPNTTELKGELDSLDTFSIANVTHVVLVCSDIWKACEHCHEWPGGRSAGDDVSLGINHYIAHGYQLLHVGSQTTQARDGSPWHCTVAVLGTTTKP